MFLGIDGREIAKRRAEEMECRDEMPEWEMRAVHKENYKKRRSTKERFHRSSRGVKSVVVKVGDKVESPRVLRELDGQESGPDSPPLLVQIPGLFQDD